jgi:hypothetical protein
MMKIAFAVITGMKLQSKLWKQIRKLAAGYYTLRFETSLRGGIPLFGGT